MQCHYEVLGVSQDADSSTIKKAHRKLAIQFHPDKNLNNEQAAEQFRSVQEAYECLSDIAERKWYDEHRDALLKGWSPNGNNNNEAHDDMLFDVIPFMHAHCYTGYQDGDEQSFYAIYGHVFGSLAKEEADAAEGNNSEPKYPFEFGDSQTELKEVATFYQVWEGFVSQQSFAWADQYDVKEAENRRVRRAMEDENKKARRKLKSARTEDVLALVRFAKRRDPRMKALKAQQEAAKASREKAQAESKRLKKQETMEARDKWRQQAEEHMAQTEEMDRLAGRVRLADLEDDYDYGGGKKKGKKGKKNKNRNNQQREEEEEPEKEEHNDEGNTEPTDAESNPDTEPQEGGDSSGDEGPQQNGFSEGMIQDIEIDPEEEYSSEEESESSEEEPDVWRCECCRKDFKSQGQMDNHMKSKKHKEAYKKYQKKIEKELMRE